MRFLIASALLFAGCQDPEPNNKDKKGPDPTVPTVPTPPIEPTPPDVELPLVVINEIVTSNGSTTNGPDGVSRPDWIELLNTGDIALDMGTLTLQNGDGDLWTGPAGEMIEPGATYLVYADDEIDADDPWTGWKIDKDEDTLNLLFDGAYLVDTTSWEEIGEDIAWARLPDGSGPWFATAFPTPGAENGDQPSESLNVPDELFFTDTMVHQIEFTLGTIAMDHINDSDRPEVPVELTIDGVYYEEVGIKLKGSASYDTMDGKPAFVVDMNQYVAGEKFRTLKKFKLHNGNVLDPTRVRDWISYKLANEAGVMAPRVGWAEVYANGEYYGIYIVIEAYDKDMIEYSYPDSRETGMIFEPNETSGGGWGGDFGSGSLDWDYETGPVPPDPDGLNSLSQADALFTGPATDAAVEELWDYVDQQNMWTYMAWEAVVAHTDGYMAPNNWRVYVDGVTHKVNFLPAGAEWTWDNYNGISSFGGNAADWCLDNVVCTRGYAEKVVEVADLADSLGLQQEFTDLSVWLDPIIQADPRYQALWGGDVGDARQDTTANLVNHPQWARNDAYALFPDLVP